VIAAKLVRELERGRAAYPLRIAGRCGYATVERLGILDGDER
jgi:hypothetical protein